MSKKVSVIMAAYNCAGTIAESVESIINQTYQNWEFIICDDGSKDDTYKILKDYAQKYPDKIIVIQNATNSKLPFSLNHCLQYVTGDYVARMDADDISYEQRLEKQVDYLEKHPEMDVVGTAMTCFNDDGVLGEYKPPITPSRDCIGLGVPFFHATIMMKRTVYDALKGYSLEKRAVRCEDVDLWMRFFGAGYQGGNIQEALYYVREDMAAVKRRKFKYGMNASKTLFWGYREYKYPLRQYIYIMKPIVSCATPKILKYWINKKRWK